MRILQRLSRDERGFVSSTELIILATIIVIGLIVGFSTWRDAVVQELGDSGAAVGQVDQSYNVEVLPNPAEGIEVQGDTVVITREFGDDGMGNPVVTATGSFNNFRYQDESDVGDEPDVDGQPPAGIVLGIPPSQEGQ